LVGRDRDGAHAHDSTGRNSVLGSLPARKSHGRRQD
jgi:hypothetical protein